MNNPFGPPPPVHIRGQWEYNYLGIPDYHQRAVQYQQVPLQPLLKPYRQSNPMASQYAPNPENPYAAEYPDSRNPFSSPVHECTAAQAVSATPIHPLHSHDRPSSPAASVESWLSSTSTTSRSSNRTVWPSSRTPTPLPKEDTKLTGLGIDTSSPGHRHEPNLPRGVYVSSGTGGIQWQLAIETAVQYHFKNADLLEEALESPDSGVTCVGKAHRHLSRDGNRGLARVGQRAMELVLTEQSYEKRLAETDAAKFIQRITHRTNLDRIGKISKIERFVRRRKSEVKKNTQVLRMLKEDVQFEDPSRTIARAMKAIFGAVYYDGGLDGVKKVMGELGLEIK